MNQHHSHFLIQQVNHRRSLQVSRQPSQPVNHHANLPHHRRVHHPFSHHRNHPFYPRPTQHCNLVDGLLSSLQLFLLPFHH
jgi:hypothetical protein